MLLMPPRLFPLRGALAAAILLIVAPPLSLAGDGASAPPCVVINEVHYDADPKTELAEFVELLNAGDENVDLSGWTLEGAGNFTFPSGTSLAAGEYLVVAEDTATMLSKFAVSTPHQYPGKLNNDGDDLRLSDAAGGLIDRVDYSAGFPWPTTARGEGPSMELMNPSLDNDLGGSWRSASVGYSGPALTFVAPADAAWHYRKGTSAPAVDGSGKQWFDNGYDEAADGEWLVGQTPIGRGDGDDNTVLSDIQNSYISVFLRHQFTVDPGGDLPGSLLLRAYYDDGCVVYINGREVERFSLAAGAIPFPPTDDFASSHEARDWEESVLTGSAAYLQPGTNTIAVQVINASIGSSDLSIDIELKTPPVSNAPGVPSPGAPNSVFTLRPPPQVRQVDHAPEQPSAGQAVTISAKVTDPEGVAGITLAYQIVDPGAYIRQRDAAFETAWIELPMLDDGSAGDAVAGDDRYTAIIPAAVQAHRRLVRYRITTMDSGGSSVRVPLVDDPQPNFAYFCYDGVPAWSGANQPGTSAAQEFPAELMADALPVYHLITNGTDASNSQYSSGSQDVRMWGTLVYDGVVYDHIQYYNRGEASTYRSGKNKWRFKFNRTHDFKARDLHGNSYKVGWKTMNFNACAAPWMPVNRGMAGFDEAVPHRLYQLAGVPSSNTHWLQFRVIGGADEAPANQYAGDLWGLYLAVEHVDGRFLDEHDLPDGNTYKIRGGAGDKKNQGPTQPLDNSDWTPFWNTSSSTGTVTWWRDNFNLHTFYGFRAINRAAGNVDLRDSTNYYMYHHPDGRWNVIPWDLDMMYIPETHWSGVIRADACLSNGEIRIEFENRCRELLDLLFSDSARRGGQAAQVVDELASVLHPPGNEQSMVDVDQFMWNYNPRSINGHNGQFYVNPKSQNNRGGTWTRTLPTPDHEGFQENMIEYMYDTRPGGGFAVGDGDERGYGFGYLSMEANDAAIPTRPAITYSGDSGFPTDGLRFTSSAFSDPGGAASFASMQWRVGEISNPDTPGYTAGEPWVYEIEELWDSGQIAPFAAEFDLPVGVLRPGHSYRARVRYFDNTGRASHWSEPLEFVASKPDVSNYLDGIVVSEIMYHPAADAALEFVEIMNIGPTTLDLAPLRFTKGIDFDFADAAITSIAPGARVLLVEDRTAFEAVHGNALPVAGEYQFASSNNLSNSGERLKLSFGAGTAIRDFDYDDAAPWPLSVDGGGPSLVLIDPMSNPDHSLATNWRPSTAATGNPGNSDASAPFAGDPDLDGDTDGRSAFMEHAMGSSDSSPELGSGYSVGIGHFDDATETERPYLTISFQRNLAADDVEFEVQVSTGLTDWSALGTLYVSAIYNGDGTETVTYRSVLPLASISREFLRLAVRSR
ncbi:MAG: hypothetical protein ACI9MB_003411 [Verrucomicrobiales bacterium]|jgi:hypothetical protein